jgi:MAP7 domain-containing protein 1
VLEEERERQLRIKELKEQAAEEALYEEQRRKAAVEAEVRRVMTLGREKQEREREEEQRRIDELRAKKEAERKRKEAEHQRLEQWRKEREQEVKEEQKRKDEQRKQEAIFLKRRVLSTAAEIKDFVKKGDKAKESKWFSGEVSIQKSGGDNLIWRRRYWKIVGQVMLLYKSAKVCCSLQIGCFIKIYFLFRIPISSFTL